MAQIESIHSYNDAVRALRGKEQRTIGHNTVAVLGHNRSVEIHLHGSPIAIFYEDGSLTLNSCGWRTPTTKDRLNQVLIPGWSVYQNRGQWWLLHRAPGQTWEDARRWAWSDPLTLVPHEDGTWTVEGVSPEADTRAAAKLRSEIQRYTRDYAKALVQGEVPAPSDGDCWHCLMREVGTNKTLGEATGDLDHLRSHFDEKYYVPSLLQRAAEVNPGKLSALAVAIIGQAWTGHSDDGREHRDWANLAEKQIAKCLQAYLLHQFGLVA